MVTNSLGLRGRRDAGMVLHHQLAIMAGQRLVADIRTDSLGMVGVAFFRKRLARVDGRELLLSEALGDVG